MPLEGYCRAGAYAPIRVEVRGAPDGAALRLAGEGVVPTVVATVNGRAQGIVPLLVLEHGAGPLRWSLGGEGGTVEVPLRPLNAEPCLVGHTSRIDPELIGRLFPGKKATIVRVDATEFGSADMASWQTMDALVTEAGVLAERQIEQLAAAGVVVALQSGAPMQGMEEWPWAALEGYRVLRPELLGPERAGVSAAAFTPVQGWRAELPRAYRKRLMLYGVLVAVVVAGAALLRGWTAAAMVVVVSLGATLALNWWWRGTAPLLERAGEVVVLLEGAVQKDQWSYRTARVRAEGTRAWTSITWPLFERPEDVSASGVELECGADGKPERFRYRLSPARRLALLTRDVSLGGADYAAVIGGGESAMHRLARRVYLRPGYSIQGALPALASGSLMREAYPTTVVGRGSSGE